MDEKKFNFDILKIGAYASFILAILFYFLSGKFAESFKVLFLIAVLFLFVGVLFVILKLFKVFLVTYQMYKSSIRNKSIEIYKSNSSEPEKELKEYKRNNLKQYRHTNNKYIILISILSIINFYILYLGLSMAFNW